MSDSDQEFAQPPSIPNWLDQILNEANKAFEIACRERHNVGEEEYGHNTFLQAPTIAMALEEAADLSNYARYTYIKLFLLQRAVKTLEGELGEKQMRAESHGFIPMSEIYKSFGANPPSS